MSDVDRTSSPVTAGGGAVSCHCVTCSDEAVPMVVRAVDAARGLALCEDEAGARSSVEISLVEPVQVGDMLLVHAGTAIA
jgi:HupF/HypC family protein